MGESEKGKRVRTFFQAVSSGDLSLAERMLAEDPSLAHAADSNGKTVLHVAAERDNPQMAEALLAAGADLEAEASWGHTPLQWAGVLGARKAAAKLMAAGAGGMNLPTAAGLGLSRQVRDFWDGDGRLRPGAALHLAIRKPDGSWGRSEPITDPDELVSEAFYQACRNGHLEVARWLKAKGAKVDRRGFFGATALQWAALNGHLETVRFLVDAGADIDAVDPEFNSTAVVWANEGRHPEIVDFLLGRGASCTAGQAAAFGKLELLKRLLKARKMASEAGSKEWSPLWQAAHWGRRDVVDWLIGGGADVNAPTRGGETPLHGAVSGGQTEILRRLLEGGADPNRASDPGVTPLHLAASRGDALSTRLLLRAGADPRAKTRKGFNAAQLAEKAGHADLARTLLPS